MCDLLNTAQVQPNKKTSQNLSREEPRTVFLSLPNLFQHTRNTERTDVQNTNVTPHQKKKTKQKKHTSHKYAWMDLVNETTVLQEQVSSEAWRRERLSPPLFCPSLPPFH